jgi:hypothetical protein
MAPNFTLRGNRVLLLAISPCNLLLRFPECCSSGSDSQNLGPFACAQHEVGTHGTQILMDTLGMNASPSLQTWAR